MKKDFMLGYRFLRGILRLLLKGLLRVQVTGLNQLKLEDNVVIISNHKSWIDPLLIMAFLPPVRFAIMAEEVSKISVGWVQTLINIAKLEFISIDRGNRKSRLKGFLSALKHIKKGGSMLVFPEGRLNQKDDVTHPYFLGAFTMAIKGEVDIIPVYMRGNEAIYFGRKVNIAIGERIHVTKDMDNEQLARQVHQIHTQVIKPDKPGPQPVKRRLDITNLFIDGVIEGVEARDIIIKGNQAADMFNEFNDAHR